MHCSLSRKHWVTSWLTWLSRNTHETRYFWAHETATTDKLCEMKTSAQFTFSSMADRSVPTHLLLKKFSLSFQLYQQFVLRAPKPAVLILYISCATPSELLCKGKRKAGLYEQLPLLHMLQITPRCTCKIWPQYCHRSELPTLDYQLNQDYEVCPNLVNRLINVLHFLLRPIQ